MTKEKNREPEEAAESYERGDFFRDLKKASRKLEPEERPAKRKRRAARSARRS